MKAQGVESNPRVSGSTLSPPKLQKVSLDPVVPRTQLSKQYFPNDVLLTRRFYYTKTNCEVVIPAPPM